MNTFVARAVCITVGFLCWAVVASPAEAATIALGGDDPRCVVSIVGEIEAGDFEKMKASVVALPDGAITLEGHLGTKNHIACLDSPGGNFYEGLKLAEYIFDEGLGTYIGTGDKCMSVCAIMFMMGRVRGGEVGGENRTLHVGGQLGFHRPYLTLESTQAYSSTDVNGAFAIAVEGIYQLTKLAGRRAQWQGGAMIPTDLLREMLEAPPGGMFLITTIEDAIRWRIDLDGFPNRTSLTRVRVFHACENMLSRPVARSSDLYASGGLFSSGGSLVTPWIFKFFPHSSYDLERVLEPSRSQNKPSETIPVANLRSGYTEAYCYVRPENDSLLICGADRNTGTWLSTCDQIGGFVLAEPLSLFHPQTQIVTLQIDEARNADASRFARCRVIDQSGTVIDDDGCLQLVEYVPNGDEVWLRHSLIWFSGSVSIVEVREAKYRVPDSATVNGSKAQFIGDDYECLLNTSTGNTLCVTMN